MIRVCFEEREEAVSLTLVGHAGAGEPGQDIVCAAASVLLYTLEAFLRERGCCPLLETEAGYGHLQIEKTADSMSAVQMAMVGYRLLAAQYPECVEFFDTTNA